LGPKGFAKRNRLRNTVIPIPTYFRIWLGVDELNFKRSKLEIGSFYDHYINFFFTLFNGFSIDWEFLKSFFKRSKEPVANWCLKSYKNLT
jgi:hypothetical protein